MELKLKIVFVIFLTSFSDAGSIPRIYPRSERTGRFIFIGPDRDLASPRSKFVRNPAVIYSWPQLPVSHKASSGISPRPVYSWREDGKGWDSVGWVASSTSTCHPSATQTVTATSRTTTTTTVYSTRTSTIPITTVTVSPSGGWSPGDPDLTCSSSTSKVTILLEPSQDPGPYSVPSATTTLTVTTPATSTVTTFTTQATTALAVATVTEASPYSITPSVIDSTVVEVKTETIFTTTTTSTTRTPQGICTVTEYTHTTSHYDVDAQSTVTICPCPPGNPAACSCVINYPTSTIYIEQTTVSTAVSRMTYYGTQISTQFTGSSVLTSTSTNVVSSSPSTVTATTTSVAPTSVVNPRPTSSYSMTGEGSLSIQAGGGDCSDNSVQPTVTSTIVESVGTDTVTITSTQVDSTTKATSVTSTQFTKGSVGTTTTTTVTSTEVTASTTTVTEPLCGGTVTVHSDFGDHTRTTGTTWITPTFTTTVVTQVVSVTGVDVATSVTEEVQTLYAPGSTTSVQPFSTEVNLAGSEVTYESTVITPTINLPSATQVILEIGCTGGTVGWSQVPG